MKTLHTPERCEVRLEPDGEGGDFVSAVEFRGQTWYTRTLLETWTYWGDWWLDAALEGESRTYFVLGTQQGELSVFHRSSPTEAPGWFVAGWFD